jgi:hypothetical protein
MHETDTVYIARRQLGVQAFSGRIRLSLRRVDPLILESFNPSHRFGTADELLARIKGLKD